jgi:hypothetical protein
MDITCSMESSGLYWNKLDEYLSKKVLNGDRFLCPHSQQCRESHSGIFYEGQLHHVGRHYDISIDGKPFRIVVVGMAYGHKPSHVSMKERYHMVAVETGLGKRFASDGVHGVRNPHKKGSTSLLRLLFGVGFGTDFDSEFITINRTERVHLFDAFAHINYLLCSAIGHDDLRTDKSTASMKNNCREHFQNCIRILEPSVVIVQGISFRKAVASSVDQLSPCDEAGILFEAEIMNYPFMLAFFTHPAARSATERWGTSTFTPYLQQVVAPTIARIREKLIVTV